MKITTAAQARKAYDRMKVLDKKKNPTAEDKREFARLSKAFSDYAKQASKDYFKKNK